MSVIAILEKHFHHRSEALSIVLDHSRMVAAKALRIARNMQEPGIDLKFVEEAALLHDIGVYLTLTPDIHCFGEASYICHGILGREILEAEGLPRHALVCERHIGVGITVKDIISQRLPLPERDMSPQTTEEKIICFADLFFSKKAGKTTREKTYQEVISNLARFGDQKCAIFNQWSLEFAPSTDR